LYRMRFACPTIRLTTSNVSGVVLQTLASSGELTHKICARSVAAMLDK